MKHLVEQSADAARSIRLKRYVGYAAHVGYGFVVGAARIALVCRDLVNCKVPGGLLNQRREHRGVIGMALGNLDACHDVRKYAGHQMDLDPIVVIDLSAILRVVPSNVLTGREPRRINCESSFNRFEREAASHNQVTQQGFERSCLEVVKETVSRRQGRDITLRVRVSQIGHKSPSAHGRIDLKRCTEKHVAQRQTRSSVGLYRLPDFTAQVAQHGLKKLLFCFLSLVIRTPILRIVDLDGLGFSNGHRLAVGYSLSPNRELDREDVLTTRTVGFKVRAIAIWRLRVSIDPIPTPAGLGRDDIGFTASRDWKQGCNLKSFLLACVHFVLAFLSARNQNDSGYQPCPSAPAVGYAPRVVRATSGAVQRLAAIRFGRMSGGTSTATELGIRHIKPLCQAAIAKSQHASTANRGLLAFAFCILSLIYFLSRFFLLSVYAIVRSACLNVFSWYAFLPSLTPSFNIAPSPLAIRRSVV